MRGAPKSRSRRTRGGRSTRMRGGSAIFPATFGGFDNVRNYSLNTYGGDPSHAAVSSRLLGGKRMRRKSRGKKSKRRGMLGGNFIGGLTPLNQTLGGNFVMNSGSLMSNATARI
jgi:hypothetical protein